MKPSCKIEIAARPGAKKTAIVGKYGTAWKLRVAAPPVDGKANAEIIRFLSEILGVSKSKISIARGKGCRNKQVGISECSLEEVTKKFEALCG